MLIFMGALHDEIHFRAFWLAAMRFSSRVPKIAEINGITIELSK